MENVKKAAKRLFFMPYWLTVLIAVPSYLFVAYVLVSGMERSVYGAAAYACSSYALVLSGTAIYRIVLIIQKIITSHRLWKRLRRDFVFRTKMILLPNTMITLIFVMVKLIAGFYYHSIWMMALGIYYLLLLLLRLSLLRRFYSHSIEIEQEKGIRAARVYGVYLLLLDIALNGIVLYSLYQGAEYSYPGYLIYAMAAYTFYAVIMAAIGYAKNHRNSSPVIVALNMVKLTTAMVSLFALETAMLGAFGEETSVMFRQSMIGATGFVIVAVIFGMALYLIIHFQLEFDRQLKRIRNKTVHNKARRH